MKKLNSSTEIRQLEKEIEKNIAPARKYFLTIGLIVGIGLTLFALYHILNAEDSELMYILGLDDSPFFAMILGIFFAWICALPYLTFGNMFSIMGGSIAHRTLMAAEAALSTLEKIEKEEQQIKATSTITPPASPVISSSRSVTLPQTGWYCSRCKTLNEPYCNICQKCGQIFADKVESLSGNTPPLNLPNIE